MVLHNALSIMAFCPSDRDCSARSTARLVRTPLSLKDNHSSPGCLHHRSSPSSEVLRFDTVSANDVSISDGTTPYAATSVSLGTPTGTSPNIAYGTMDIKLAEGTAGANDQKKFTVTVSNDNIRRPTSTKAVLAGTRDHGIWCLLGDTNLDGRVTMEDITKVRTMMGPSPGCNGVISATTCIYDVNIGGGSPAINIVDMAQVRNRMDKCLPGYCPKE